MPQPSGPPIIPASPKVGAAGEIIALGTIYGQLNALIDACFVPAHRGSLSLSVNERVASEGPTMMSVVPILNRPARWCGIHAKNISILTDSVPRHRLPYSKHRDMTPSRIPIGTIQKRVTRHGRVTRESEESGVVRDLWGDVRPSHSYST